MPYRFSMPPAPSLLHAALECVSTTTLMGRPLWNASVRSMSCSTQHLDCMLRRPRVVRRDDEVRQAQLHERVVRLRRLLLQHVHPRPCNDPLLHTH